MIRASKLPIVLRPSARWIHNQFLDYSAGWATTVPGRPCCGLQQQSTAPGRERGADLLADLPHDVRRQAPGPGCSELPTQTVTMSLAAIASRQTSLALKAPRLMIAARSSGTPSSITVGSPWFDHGNLEGIRVNTDDVMTELDKTCPGTDPT